MNLLTPIKPMGWSRFLPELPVATNGQFQGFVYFGLGIFLLAGPVPFPCGSPPSRSQLAALAPLLLACAVLGAMAVSPKVTFGARVLGELPRTPYVPFESFRASGRSPVPYVLLYLLLRRVARHLPWSGASAVVLAVLAIESPTWATSSTRSRATIAIIQVAWQQPLHCDAWRSATERYRQMVIVPSAGWDQDTEVAFTLFAGRSGLAINTGSPARVDWSALRRSRDALQRQLADGPLDASTVYVVHPRDIDGFVTAHRGRISCRAIDAFHAAGGLDGGA